MLSKFSYLLLASFIFPLTATDGVKLNPSGIGLQVQFASIINGGPANMTFYNGIIRLSEIEFEGEEINGKTIEYQVEQLTTIDLTTALASPALNPIMIPAGEYEELQLEVQGAKNGRVIYLEGSFTDSKQNLVPLLIDIQESLSLEIAYKNYTVDSSPSFDATFLVDPTYWFSNISYQDLQQADRDSNGVVRISPINNIPLYKKLTADLSEGIEWQWGK
ncbi:MAG: hypothetical protein AB8H47_27085 [Bacteroidia bacterium]